MTNHTLEALVATLRESLAAMPVRVTLPMGVASTIRKMLGPEGDQKTNPAIARVEAAIEAATVACDQELWEWHWVDEDGAQRTQIYPYRALSVDEPVTAAKFTGQHPEDCHKCHGTGRVAIDTSDWNPRYREAWEEVVWREVARELAGPRFLWDVIFQGDGFYEARVNTMLGYHSALGCLEAIADAVMAAAKEQR